MSWNRVNANKLHIFLSYSWLQPQKWCWSNMPISNVWRWMLCCTIDKKTIGTGIGNALLKLRVTVSIRKFSRVKNHLYLDKAQPSSYEDETNTKILWWPWRWRVMPLALTYHSSGCPPSSQWWSSVIPVTVFCHSSGCPPSLHVSHHQQKFELWTLPHRLIPPTYRRDMDIPSSWSACCIWISYCHPL